jgi:DNA-binding winged helix-turn-helix (wHTH) protein/tetratricopeptide (TPR) repeat protein
MIFVFGDFELDEEQWELRRAGKAVVLQPKTLALLFYLVRERDRVVSKDELLERVWADSVVTESSLTRTVSLARLAVDDRGAEPAVIRTVARRGYRFGAPVRVASAGAPAEDAAAPDRGPRYVGREDLRARLEASLDAALAGRGRILFLAGEAGIGKTRTAELLASRARRGGADLAAAWGIEEEGAPTYWAWARIVRSLGEAAGRGLSGLLAGRAAPVARLAPDLFGDAGAPRSAAADESRGGEAERFQLFEAVQTFLARCASRRPLALVLDDLHWADAESLWLLEFVGHGLESLPVAVIATCREHEPLRAPERSRALEKLRRLTTLEHWPLSGLSEREVADFVRERTGAEAPRGLAEALARKTGGNPLFLDEVVRSLAARDLLRPDAGAQDWDEVLPQGIQHLLAQKLGRVSEEASQVLGCAAAIGVEFTRGVLAQALDREVDLGGCLREAVQAGLVAERGPGQLRFVHALVRDALETALAPSGSARRALHARIAGALESASADSDEAIAERAHHACEAAPLFDPARAAELARRAALRAAGFHDFDGAEDWYRRAIDVLALAAEAEPARRAELWLGFADAQRRTVGLDRARPVYRHAAEQAETAARGDLVARAALGFAHRPDAGGAGDRAVIAVLESALRGVPEDAPVLRTRLLSRLAAELRYADRPRAEALVSEAVEAARGLGDAATLAQALDDSTFVRFSPDDPEAWVLLNGEVVRAARAAGDLELEIAGHAGCWTGFLELGDLGGVDRAISECETAAAELRTPHARWMCAAVRAMRTLLDGRLAAAEEKIEESLRWAEDAQSPDVALQSLAQLVYLRIEQGRAAEIEEAARGQMQRFPDAPAWRAALAALLVSAGRLDEARRELARLSREGFGDVPRDRGWVPTLAFSSEVAHASRDVASAEMLHALLAPYARLCVVAGGFLFYGSVSHHLGLLTAVRGRSDEALAHLERALRMHERVGARVWGSRTQIAMAEVLSARRAAGDADRAADLAAEALATARALGLQRVAASVERLDLAPRGAAPR